MLQEDESDALERQSPPNKKIIVSVLVTLCGGWVGYLLRR